MIRFACPKCKEINRCSDDDAGRVVACSACGQKARVPALKKTEARPAPPEPEEEPAEVEEEAAAPAPRPKAKVKPRDDEEPDDRDADEERREEPDEDEEDRPKKKKKKASEVLGRRQATYEPRKDLLRILLVVFGITGVLGVLFFILGLFIHTVNSFTEVCFPLSIFMIPTGAIVSWWCWSILSLKVVLHEGGLVHAHKGKKRIIPWDEILSVKQAVTEHYTNGAYTGTTYHYTLELEDGQKIVYTNYRLRKVEDLGNEIMERTTRVLLPQAVRDYKKGKVVEFGPLGVSEDGLHYGKSLLDWDDIKGVKIKEGYISVSKRGKWLNWCNIAASSVPNLMVFLEMVNQIAGVDEG